MLGIPCRPVLRCFVGRHIMFPDAEATEHLWDLSQGSAYIQICSENWQRRRLFHGLHVSASSLSHPYWTYSPKMSLFFFFLYSFPMFLFHFVATSSMSTPSAHTVGCIQSMLLLLLLQHTKEKYCICDPQAWSATAWPKVPSTNCVRAWQRRIAGCHQELQLWPYYREYRASALLSRVRASCLADGKVHSSHIWSTKDLG